MDSINIFLKVPTEEVSFICTILEAYEGMAAIRTPNPTPGSQFTTLQTMVSPDFLKEFENVLQDLLQEINIERVSA